MRKANISDLARRIALVGNTIYILWLFYNGIDEGFRGLGLVQAVAITGLLFLLVLNIVLLSRKDVR